MFSNPFQTSQSPWAILFWVLLLSLLALVGFARQRTGWVLLGWLRVLLSLVVAPLKFLAGLVNGFGIYGERGEAALDRNRRGLLDAFLGYLKAGVAATAILVIGLGLVGSWKALMPTDYAVRYEKNSALALTKATTDLVEPTRQLETFKGGLEAKRGALVNEYRAARNETIKTSKAAMADREKVARADFRTNPVMTDVAAYLARPENAASSYALTNAREAVENHTLYKVNLERELTQSIRDYADAWVSLNQAQQELRDFTEGQINTILESERASLENRVKELQVQLEAATRDHQEAKTATELRFSGFFLALLGGFAALLGFLWSAGLILGLVELMLGGAANLKALRDHFLPEPDPVQPTPKAPAAIRPPFPPLPDPAPPTTVPAP